MASLASALNTGIGTVFNAVGAATAISNSVKSLFGGPAVPPPGPNSVSSINNLKSKLSKLDILSNNLFYVQFVSPPMMGPSAFDKDLSLLCYQAQLPGVSFASSEVRRYGMGPSVKSPTLPQFTDMSLTFVGDGQGIVRNYFLDWMNRMVFFTEGGGGPLINNNAPFEIEYKAQYATRINIVSVDRYNRAILVTELHDAFPIALGDQQLSWQDMDSLMSVNVTMTYRNWRTQTLDVGSIADGAPPAPSLLGNLVKVSTALQTLATIRMPTSIGDIVNVTRSTTSAISAIKGIL